jgi:hypothetical protein
LAPALLDEVPEFRLDQAQQVIRPQHDARIADPGADGDLLQQAKPAVGEDGQWLR